MAISDNFALSGSYSTTPNIGNPSGQPNLTSPIEEDQVLIEKQFNSIELDVDSAVSVPFGGVTGATVLIVKCVGGKIRVRITSSDGSSQAIPCDSFIAITTDSTYPITAVDLTRLPGVVTTCSVFLGQSA